MDLSQREGHPTTKRLELCAYAGAGAKAAITHKDSDQNMSARENQAKKNVQQKVCRGPDVQREGMRESSRAEGGVTLAGGAFNRNSAAQPITPLFFLYRKRIINDGRRAEGKRERERDFTIMT